MSDDETIREPGIEFQDISEDDEEPFIEMEVTLTEDGVKNLEHGSGTSWSFPDTDHPIDGVYVNSERDLDRDWLLDEDTDDDSVSETQWRVIAAWGTTMAGIMWMVNPLVGVYPEFVGGIVALLSGIYLIEQVDGQNASAEVID